MAAVLSCLGAPAALKGPRSVAARSVPRPAPALARHAKRSAGAARGSALVVSATALAGEKDRLKAVSNLDKVAILAEALPYLQKFHGKTVVIKYGGAAMKDGSLKEGVIRDLVLLATVGIRPVLVHGGGPEINGWLQKMNIEPKFLNGLRVTDGPTMEIVEMVLSGKVNKSLVSLINQAGGTAVGLSGKDGNLLRGRIMDPALGFVGEVTNVNPRILGSLLESEIIPVVATVATDENGQALNINADTAAAEIAAALSAEKLILMTDVMGVLKNKDDPSTLIPEVSINGVRKLIKDGIVAGGMIPKVQCAVRAIAQGVSTCHIIDGRSPHSLLLEVLTEKGSGTMITG